MVESDSKIERSTPLVSICCLTYNHRPFIGKCLEGFLMQESPSCVTIDTKMSDWCEILIHDDCSTDGTTEIIKEYAAKYPDLILPLYEEENQYDPDCPNKMDLYNYKRAKGKYIAYCEGDDFWTDPLKLRKQVDFMEKNPEYSICFHGADMLFYNKEGVIVKKIEYNGNCKNDGFDVSSTMFINGKGGGQPLTMVFRKDCYDYSWFDYYDNYRDTMELYQLLKVGKGRFLNFNGGQYNIFNGISATMDNVSRWKISLHMFEQMFSYNKDVDILPLIEKNALWGFEVCNKPELKYEAWKAVLGIFKISFLTGRKVLFTQIKRECSRLLKKCKLLL